MVHQMRVALNKKNPSSVGIQCDLLTHSIPQHDKKAPQQLFKKPELQCQETTYYEDEEPYNLTEQDIHKMYEDFMYSTEFSIPDSGSCMNSQNAFEFEHRLEVPKGLKRVTRTPYFEYRYAPFRNAVVWAVVSCALVTFFISFAKGVSNASNSYT